MRGIGSEKCKAWRLSKMTFLTSLTSEHRAGEHSWLLIVRQRWQKWVWCSGAVVRWISRPGCLCLPRSGAGNKLRSFYIFPWICSIWIEGLEIQLFLCVEHFCSSVYQSSSNLRLQGTLSSHASSASASSSLYSIPRQLIAEVFPIMLYCRLNLISPFSREEVWEDCQSHHQPGWWIGTWVPMKMSSQQQDLIRVNRLNSNCFS